VTWTNIVNATVIGNVLQKTGGFDGVDDAGATSQQQLTAGDGYVQFTVGETNTFWLGGLSNGNQGTGFADIDFAFRFNGACSADVLENGIYASGDTPYATGDVFRVAIVSGRVQYFTNGTFLRESAITPTYPFLLDVALGSLGATVSDAVLGFTPAPSPGAGFIETAGSPALRPRFTRAQIDKFLLPDGAKGAFTFPAPYNTQGVRLTNASDCAGGSDCLWYVGYSYWRNMNNHVGSADMYIFLGTDPNNGDEQLPKGNLDVTGKYFLWTTNLGGSRLDTFLVKIPAERLNGSQEFSEVTTQNSEPCGRMRADAAPRGRGGSGCAVTGAHGSVRVSP
jgi:hypothetical protein